jgi:hypothetical protein
MGKDPFEDKETLSLPAYYSQFENADHFHDTEEHTVPDWWDLTSQHIEKHRPPGTPLNLQTLADEPHPKAKTIDDDD